MFFKIYCLPFLPLVIDSKIYVHIRLLLATQFITTNHRPFFQQGGGGGVLRFLSKKNTFLWNAPCFPRESRETLRLITEAATTAVVAFSTWAGACTEETLAVGREGGRGWEMLIAAFSDN